MISRSLSLAFCLGLLLATLASPAWAASLRDVINTLETPFKTETDKEFRIYDYTADFFQESKISSLDRLQRANGRVAVSFDYSRPQTVPGVRFRWEYDRPTNQEIVSDGETLWVYLPENNQVIQSNIEMVNRSRQNDPMTFLTGLGNLSRDFLISWASPNYDIEGNYILELTPRKVSSLMNRLIMIVDRNAVEAYVARDNQEASENNAPANPPAMPSMSAPASGFGFPAFDQGAGGSWFPFLSTTVYDPNGNSTIIEFSNLRVNMGLSEMSFGFILPAGVQVVRPTGKEMGF